MQTGEKENGKKKKIRPIRLKIFTGFIAIAIFTEIMVLAGIFYTFMRDEVSRYYTQTGQALSLLSGSFETNLSELEQSLVYKIDASDVFSVNETTGNYDFTYQRNVKRLANLLQMSKVPVYSIYCMNREGRAVYYCNSNASFESIEAYRNSEAFGFAEKEKEGFQSRYGASWFYRFEENPDHFYMIKNVIDPSTTDYRGLLILEVDQSYLREQYRDLEENYHCSIVVYGKDGAVLSCEDADDSVALQYAADNHAGGGSTENEIFGHYLVTSRNVRRNGWTISAFMPEGRLLDELRETFPWILVLSIGILLLSILISRRMATSQTKSIYAMVDQVQGIRDGKSDALHKIRIDSNDELQFLGDTLNGMIDQLNASVQRIADARIEKDRAEYNALVAQMDPHFLYNTLEGINSLARLHGDQDIVECINRLSRLYRTAVHGAEDEIPLREEFGYVDSYLELEKLIVGNRIFTEVDPDPETLDLPVPKLIVQPIVENSIRHGVRDMKEGGAVIVTSMIRDGKLEIDVSDNGRGMPQEMIDQFLRAEDTNGRHVGIGAVNRRIRILYGEQYGLRIESSEEGTTVSILLPVRRVTLPEEREKTFQGDQR